MISVKNIEIANLGLIGLSLALAFALPFRLFLFAYAVLGPLHYLTELNWLHEKRYFVKSQTWLPLILSLVVVVALPKIVSFLNFSESPFLQQFINGMNSISNGAIFVALWTAVTWVVVKPFRWKLISVGTGFIFAYLLDHQPIYTVLVGSMLPTVLHVYLFTGLFMLYGALKTKSILGYMAIVALVLAPLVIVFSELSPKIYDIPAVVKQTFIDNGFYKVNISLAKLFGVTDGKTFLFYGSWELKVQTFIAFAYIYHYLNWFSKTAIIGWHRGLKGKKATGILVIWIVHVALFAIDYRIGFMSALALSFLHVFAEFPLNAVSIWGIGGQLAKRLN